MMRQHPTLIVFGVSALAVFGAMAWLTRHALSLEHQRLTARAESQVQEKVRLALWRMDSKAGVLIARESARPYFEYQPFHATDRAYTRMLEEVRPGEVLVPSPLLAAQDRVVQLYFQVDSKGAISSPQAPTGNLRDLAEASYISPESVIAADERIKVLDVYLRAAQEDRAGREAALNAEHASAQATPQHTPLDARSASKVPPADLTREHHTPELPGESAPPPPAPALGAASPTNGAAQSAVLPEAEPPTPPTQPPARQQAQGPIQQSIDEYRARVSANLEAKDNTTTQNRAPSAKPAPAGRGTKTGNAQLTKEDADETGGTAPSAAPLPNPSTPGPLALLDLRSKESAEKQGNAVDAGTSQTPSTKAAEPATPQPPREDAPPTDSAVLHALDLAHSPPAAAYSSGPDAEAGVSVGPFGAGWVCPAPSAPSAANAPPPHTAQLVFLRDVRIGSADAFRQGFWVDWPVWRADLLAAVKDLLPNADVQPVTRQMALDQSHLERRLASFPAEVIPGDVPIAAASLGANGTWSALHNTLLLAWIGVLAALAAIAFLLRAATDLAERRGRFVSAVTHELRTPLTTFVMYSQMLADGMVPEGDARQHYYTTLKREAGRLAGIVENVLEFARLSRRNRTRKTPGTAPGGSLRAGELLERLVLPLRQRVEHCGGTLDAGIEGAQDAASTLIATDELTLERILFNLVDNACKYGSANADTTAPAPTPCVVSLRLRLQGPWLVFTVTDNGPGIPPADHARIFKAFERGTKQADGSIPGLGLGLALSKGLAKDLGGDLTLLTPVPATFELRVPRERHRLRTE